MKRVLIITYYWPPAGGSGVQRWLKMAKYLPSYGWQPVIYTPENPDMTLTDPTLAREVSAAAEILKRPIREPYALFRKLTGGKKGEGSTSVNPIRQSSGASFMMKLSLWARANLFIPDPKAGWVRPSVRYLVRYLEKNPVDVIISTGPPHSMHLIAMKVAAATGVRWIADFRDPWTKIFYFKHLPLTMSSRRRYEQMESEVVAKADEVVVVTDKMNEEFSEIARMNGSCTPVYTIENGFDESDFRKDTPLDSDFTLVHTGLFSDEGNPLELWKVLKELCEEEEGFSDRLKIRLIGKVDKGVAASIREAGLEGVLELCGYLSHEGANRAQEGAHILLLPLRTEPESAAILTGKYFEYLAAGRPIIAFGPHRSVLESSLQKTGAGRVFEWDEHDSLKSAIISLFREEGRSDLFDPEKEEIEKYSRRKLAGEMAKLMNNNQDNEYRS